MINLKNYQIEQGKTIREALFKIDANKKGFLLVMENERVIGTLTDGDIRRSLLKGVTLEKTIDQDIYNTEFSSLKITDNASNAIDLFKNEGIEFLPVLDGEGRFVNLITKQQLHAVLLLDIRADLLFDFFKLDEHINDYEIYQRPWGFYKTTVMNDYFQSKVISVSPGARLSLQSHNHREEYWIVAHGKGMAQIGESMINISCGSYLFIPKGCKHRLTNTDEMENLIITEVQIGDYFGEDDIIRYADDYGRKVEKVN